MNREEAKDEILERVATGCSLFSALACMEGAPSRSTVYNWLRDDASFKFLYEEAQLCRTEKAFNEMKQEMQEAEAQLKQAEADDLPYCILQACKMRIHELKWRWSKTKGRYKNKFTHNTTA